MRRQVPHGRRQALPARSGGEDDPGLLPLNRPALVLASGSPRRRELLAGLGLRFTVRPAEIDETPHPGEPPADYVLRLAREKAAAVATETVEELVLAADTSVVIDGEILGKPLDEEDARRMLRLLAGREHEVLTGVALRNGQREATHLEITKVRMAPLTDGEVAWYAATDEPHDKAGAYAAQGLGALFIEAVHGNYSNVVGLPLPVVYKLFAALGYDLKALIARG